MILSVLQRVVFQFIQVRSIAFHFETFLQFLAGLPFQCTLVIAYTLAFVCLLGEHN